jgi:hypothetical protein
MRIARTARLTILGTGLLLTLAWVGVRGQSTEINNWIGIDSGSGCILTLSKGGEQAGSFSVPAGRDFVVGFNQGQPHSHDADGSHFEFHGDFKVYPQPPSYGFQSRFHPDKTDFQWASEGPVSISGHDMDLLITRVR